MSTVYRNNQAKRISQLSLIGEVLVHSNDLASLWQIDNKNTLHTTLKRYCKTGLLNRIYKGFFSLKPINSIDKIFLGFKAINEYCYLSTETVLYQYGYISNVPRVITFISRRGYKFEIGDNNYKSRAMSEKFLFNPIGISKIDGYMKATQERAIADMLYYNPHFHFDKKPNWKNVINIQRKLGYPLTPERYDIA